jgi:nicotinate-nucleotide adenylyltransferase
MSDSIQELQANVNNVFLEQFDRTPLRERIDDILREAMELHRFTNFANIKEETGDLIATTIQLCNESVWDAEDIVRHTLEKIERRKLQYKSLGRKEVVAIIGGAFNPPTKGHIKLAQFVLNSNRTFDSVWLMPCYQHMYNKSMVSPEHRLEMCKLAAKSDGRILVSDYEISNKLRGETYRLIKRLLNENFAKDEYDFSIVIGLDNANTFDKWVNYEELERMARFVVVPRRGINRNPKVTWYLKPPHIFLSPDNDIPEISSTQIREAFNQLSFERNEYDILMNFINRHIEPEVLGYINEHNLYY